MKSHIPYVIACFKCTSIHCLYTFPDGNSSQILTITQRSPANGCYTIRNDHFGKTLTAFESPGTNDSQTLGKGY